MRLSTIADLSIILGASTGAYIAYLGTEIAKNPLGAASILVSIFFTVVATYEKLLRIKYLKKRFKQNGNS